MWTKTRRAPPRPPASAHRVMAKDSSPANGTARTSSAGPARMAAAADR